MNQLRKGRRIRIVVSLLLANAALALSSSPAHATMEGIYYCNYCLDGGGVQFNCCQKTDCNGTDCCNTGADCHGEAS